MERLKFAVEWRGCAGCIEDVQTVLKNTAGIRDARGDFSGGTLDITYDPAIINPREVVERVSALGFRARVVE